VELKLLDGAGDLAMHFRLDYIHADPSRPCGYGTLGVEGGDGAMYLGDPDDILAVSSSLDRNLNGCGYCLTEDSPATDVYYTTNPDYPDWDYRMVYEVWIDAAAFGDAGYGGAVIESVHASPSKTPDDTLIVQPEPCPPDWDVPYCPPHLLDEGASCGGDPPGTGGSGGTGTGGSGGTGTGGSPTGTGGSTNTACPPGTVPDLESEGAFCVPE
jgi:hypothetical protein